MSDLVLTPVDFVAVLNQTLENAYPNVAIEGELANLRVSKNRWVYFDLKDEYASVKFFGTVYQLPGPLEDGLLLQVRGQPRLHPLYGFSVNIQTIQPVGEGSLKRAAALLEAKLTAEGLFDPERKRPLPYPPKRIGLITSSESAAYVDFMKILNSRWGGIEIDLADVQVQGEAAPAQLIAAIEYFNSHAEPPDILVLTRGGGSAEDLAAFSTEQVTRAVAASRIPTLVAIGHEVDVSLAELAADQRASTPSNAAELMVPDKTQILRHLPQISSQLSNSLVTQLDKMKQAISDAKKDLSETVNRLLEDEARFLRARSQLLEALNPEAALRRGYAIVRTDSGVVRSIKQIKPGQTVGLRFADGTAEAGISSISKK